MAGTNEVDVMSILDTMAVYRMVSSAMFDLIAFSVRPEAQQQTIDCARAHV